MDSAEFLDLLGNANRRRILQLLARKPCYVTEISEFLGVSPKAVIDHLRKLEDAGLVESRTDDRRRKYFSIARHIRLEVTVSPYEFGTKSAYPASSHLDITSCRRVSIELEDGSLPVDGQTETPTDAEEPEDSSVDETTPDTARDETEATPQEETTPGDGLQVTSSENVVALVQKLRDFEQLERELSLAHRWAEGQITELRDRLAQSVGSSDPRLMSEILLALAEDTRNLDQLSRETEVPPQVLEEILDELASAGVVYRDGNHWQLVE